MADAVTVTIIVMLTTKESPLMFTKPVTGAVIHALLNVFSNSHRTTTMIPIYRCGE